MSPFRRNHAIGVYANRTAAPHTSRHSTLPVGALAPTAPSTAASSTALRRRGDAIARRLSCSADLPFVCALATAPRSSRSAAAMLWPGLSAHLEASEQGSQAHRPSQTVSASQLPAPPASGVLASKTKLTKARQLAKALKACNRDKKKSKRLACEKQARRKYAPPRKKAKK